MKTTTTNTTTTNRGKSGAQPRKAGFAKNPGLRQGRGSRNYTLKNLNGRFPPRSTVSGPRYLQNGVQNGGFKGVEGGVVFQTDQVILVEFYWHVRMTCQSHQKMQHT
jgi:hypothetical protein